MTRILASAFTLFLMFSASMYLQWRQQEGYWPVMCEQVREYPIPATDLRIVAPMLESAGLLVSRSREQLRELVQMRRELRSAGCSFEIWAIGWTAIAMASACVFLPLGSG